MREIHNNMSPGILLFCIYMYRYNVKGACASVHDDILLSLSHSVISPSSGEKTVLQLNNTPSSGQWVLGLC